MNLALPFQRIKTLSWSDFFQVVQDELAFFQIIPDVTATNGIAIEQITQAIHSIYKPFIQRIEPQGFKIVYTKPDKVAYAILFNDNKVTFHMAIPKQWQSFLQQRVYSVWSKATIKITDKDYLGVFNKAQCLEYEFGLRNRYFNSISYDYRENAYIPSVVSTIKELKEGDKALLEIILNPVDYMWKIKAQEDLQKFKKGVIEENITGFGGKFLDFIDKTLTGTFSVIDNTLSMKVEEKKPKRILLLNGKSKTKPSTATETKTKYDAFETHIRVISQSEDDIRRHQVAQGIHIALNTLAEDNEFKVVKMTNHERQSQKKGVKIPFMKVRIGGKSFVQEFNRDMPSFTKHNIMTTKEVGQLLQMPTVTWQAEYPEIENIELAEINMPKELFMNGIPIGNVRYKGVVKQASWNTHDKDVRALPVLFAGMQGVGKTEAIACHAVSAVEHGQSAFILDGIKNCELADKIRDYLPEDFPEEKIIDLDFSNLDFIIPLAWNEVNLKAVQKNSDKYMLANHITQQLMFFLDTLTDQPDQKLSPRMRRYLSSAGLLVFAQPNTTIMDVLNVLVNFETRHTFIANSGLGANNKIVQDLLSLDTQDGNTKEAEIKGIIDRMNMILCDYVLSALFSAKSNPEINFTKWANEGYVVLCKMPQGSLNDTTINLLTTFLISKIWLAILMRGDGRANYETYKVCNVYVDEIHRIPLAPKFLNNIREQRKYGLKYVFSAHQPKDFKSLLPTLKSSGCSYVLFSTSKDNWKLFEEELKPFTIEQCLKTEKYHAKVIANFDKEYVTFDANMNGYTLDKTHKKIDRSHLTEQCSIRYGVPMVEN